MKTGWREVALGDVLTDVRPGFASGDNLEEGIFQVRMSNVTHDGRFVTESRRRVNASNKSVPATLLEPGDVLFNATNSKEHVGKTAYFAGCDEPAVFSNHFLRLRTNDGDLDPKFLTRWLQERAGSGYFAAKCRSWVNQSTFDQKSLVALPIPLPSIEEQRRIAAVLDAADALRAKRRQALAKLDNLAQSIFLDMFGDPTLPTTEIGDLAKVGSGGTPKKGEAKYYENGTVPWVTSGQLGGPQVTEYSTLITETALRETSVKLWPAGTLLVAMYGEGKTRGNCSELTFDSTTNQACAAIVLKADAPVSRTFVRTFLMSRYKENRQLASGGVQPNLSLGLVKAMRVPIPGSAALARFDAAIASVQTERVTMNKASVTLDALFASLQQRAFRGDL